MTDNREELENEEYEYVEEVETSEEDVLNQIKKYGTYIVVALIAIVGGVWGYGQYQDSQAESSVEASTHFNKAVLAFEKQSFEEALNGSEPNSQMSFKGFKAIADQYSGTEIANTAAFYAGKLLLTNDNQSAKSYFSKAVASSSMMTRIGAHLGLANVYEQENDYSNAAKNYLDASNMTEYKDLKVKYLYFSALNYMEAGDKGKSEELFKKVIKLNKNVDGDKYKGLAEAKLAVLGTKFY